MAGFCTPIRFVLPVCTNLNIFSHIRSVTLQGCKGQIKYRLYSDKKIDLEEKRRKFQELENEYQGLLCIDKLTSDEKTIHYLHAEAVLKGHFTYDDPFLNEKVLTRLRHFLKGKCCGKSCRHCIYEHTAVVDEEKKSKARFNSSFWVYDGGLDEDVDDFDEQHVVTYGRGPYPKKYAQNAPQNMIKIPSKPKPMPQ
ncbi:hypothetical protein ONE63_004301 [Megalurothrips usitatus]|uniref:Uncharacterized protein n=1 Tax=Megalurothrips usitatus TaxID=439358 RepID=A0AAV7X380_9NEOP|nr:hypothetical protein ONE63_004301 [Megalurothrips usitatus]